MKIAVTTPSGHVGSAVVDFLLDFGGDIRVKLLARRPKDLDRFVRRGAELVIGSQDDADFLVSATHDVDALFWVTPPGYGSDNVRAFQNRLGIAGAFAIRDNRIPRVVNLSSIGAQLSSGVGPICGLYDVEGILDEAADNITHLRPGFFFENFLMQLDSITKWGRISLPLSGSRSYPMIAARDIGRVAAMRLSDPTWKGMYIRELHGPADMSFDEAAEIISQVLGRKILFIRSDKQEARHVLLNTGMSENLADLLLEMYDAVESGRLQPLQPRSLESTTPTTLTEFVHEVMLPLIAQPVAH
ncbi:MAG: NmrA family NAD(P)-binding protein [Thermoguttaceae bacterium]|jgi:uncharacterized protein YbjT (DUF2867 family)